MAIRIRLPWEVATRARVSLRPYQCLYSTKPSSPAHSNTPAASPLGPVEPSAPPGYLPLTGLFAVNKPAEISSTTILDLIQYVCQRNKTHPLVKGALALDNSKRAKRGLVKIGHGGTLDPLARGVVVVGMGSGCKKLHNMSGSSKVYIAEARLGISSTTLDNTGSLVARGPTEHITQEKLAKALQKFIGEISQVPPLYSALSMDGKRLYEYAREGIPLPREIPSRKVNIYGLDLLSFDSSTETMDPQDSAQLYSRYGFKSWKQPIVIPASSPSSSSSSSLPSTLISTIGPSFGLKCGYRPKIISDPGLSDPDHIPIPPPSHSDDKSVYGVFFHIRVHCSSGTYIRTLIADIAAELGTVGHMTDLLRVEQSGYKLNDTATLEFTDCEDIEKVDKAIQAGNAIWESRVQSIGQDGEATP
ncbi:tRNA pseudouridine55 synthase [Entomortierella parvispora]|uniref:tRNA pseudouridine(55) synthase n=1 Tax=Entomortierella parvispora TaxID=205924 RepID=A0A9P3HH96_9FUNG|nr:tRNA pseudouridine55 synthase [Entomortierella parvispora]